MKRLKKFYQNNRIYCILMLISFICIFGMLTAVGLYFSNQLHSSKYGIRLEGIEKYKLGKAEFKAIEESFKAHDDVKKVEARLSGRIIYVDVEVNKDTSNETIQNYATESLTKLSDENKEYYDVQFLVTREGYNTYLGSKSHSNTVISWINYKFTDEEADTATTSSEYVEDDDGTTD